MRRRTQVIGVAIMLTAAPLVVGAAQTVRRGFSAKDEPSPIEAAVAKAMRRYAAPGDLRGRKNPVPLTPAALEEGKAHFADHCAVCHGNDGKGDTPMGPNFYPKVPDMTLPDTQSQSDRELFATIENGIRLTGMPACGNGTAESAWQLDARALRHLVAGGGARSG